MVLERTKAFRKAAVFLTASRNRFFLKSSARIGIILNSIVTLEQGGKCILLITHKASTLHIADRILRMDGEKGFTPFT